MAEQYWFTFDLIGSNVSDGAMLSAEVMPDPSEYLSEVQRDGKPLGANPTLLIKTWRWLDARGRSQFVAPRLIEA